MQPDTLEHLKDARMFLETGMARLAAQRASDDDIQLLRTRMDEHRAGLPSTADLFLAPRHGLPPRDRAPERQPDLPRPSSRPSSTGPVPTTSRWCVRPASKSLTLEEHTRLVDAIAANDADAAEEAVRAHLSRSNERYRSLLPGPASAR
jgi:DNA-binding FadR family transcriptional regulator